MFFEDRRGSGLVSDPDAAVRAAIKSAVDAGRYELAAKLLEVLKSAPVAVVLPLHAVRR